MKILKRFSKCVLSLMMAFMVIFSFTACEDDEGSSDVAGSWGTPFEVTDGADFKISTKLTGYEIKYNNDGSSGPAADDHLWVIINARLENTGSYTLRMYKYKDTLVYTGGGGKVEFAGSYIPGNNAFIKNHTEIKTGSANAITGKFLYQIPKEYAPNIEAAADYKTYTYSSSGNSSIGFTLKLTIGGATYAVQL